MFSQYYPQPIPPCGGARFSSFRTCYKTSYMSFLVPLDQEPRSICILLSQRGKLNICGNGPSVDRRAIRLNFVQGQLFP
ncbi:hypothetical protein M8818_006108 [Zalaria obscura]|uniref:Uncharacterized protein n=1 Tax=Zalaria obscura TaxID=2024903 RepID=A0ACC3S720_9PEZI